MTNGCSDDLSDTEVVLTPETSDDYDATSVKQNHHVLQVCRMARLVETNDDSALNDFCCFRLVMIRIALTRRYKLKSFF